MVESSTVEYKFKLNDSFEKEVVAFLNSDTGGTIYIGVDDSGRAVGVPAVDSYQLQIKDRLKNNVSPLCLEFCSVEVLEIEEVNVVVVKVKSGLKKPYFLRRFGMCPSGCFKRVGSSCEAMEEDEISRLYRSRLKNTLTSIPSPVSSLTFRQLKIYYEGVGKSVNERFLSNLQLLTPAGEPNYAAYLLSDSPQVFFRVAKYAGEDRVELVEADEFGGCSLMKAFDMVYDRLSVENKTFARITPGRRQERRLVDSLALREAVLNAFVHNDYSYSAVPKFEFFSDRLEITSAGGLPFGMSVSELFSGISVPRNPEIARVFRDLEYIEVLGSGVPRILRVYGAEAFVVSENFIRVTLPFSKDEEGDSLSRRKGRADEDGGINGGLQYIPLGDGGINGGLQYIPLGSDGGINGGLQYIPLGGDGEIHGSRKTIPQEREYAVPAGKIVVSANERLVLSVVRDVPEATVAMVSASSGLSLRQVERVLARLKEAGVLRRIGSRKAGGWEILVDEEDLVFCQSVAERRAEYRKEVR